MSDSLAKIGTAMVEVSRYAVVTHGIAVESVQLRDDPRHRGAHDGLVERRQQQREQETSEGSGQLPAS